MTSNARYGNVTRMLGVLIGLALTVTLVAPADAAMQGTGRTTRIAASLDVPLPPGDVRVHRAPCPGDDPDVPCAGPNETGAWDIYIPKGWMDAEVLAHELGHAFDDMVLTDTDHARFQRLLRTRGPWEHDAEEAFADAYAACARHEIPGTSGWSTGAYYHPGTARHHRRVCREIRRVG